MAANLTAEQIAKFLSDPSLYWYGQPMDGWRVEGDGNAGFSYKHPGQDMYDSYDAQGNYLSSKGDKYTMTPSDYLKFAAAVTGVGALNGGFAGLSGVGSSTGAGSGLLGGGETALGNGAFLGEAPWAATPGATALDFGGAAAAGGGAAGGAASGAAGGVPFNAAADSAAASKALGYTGAELGNILSPAATAAGGVGGLLSGLSPYAGIIGAGLGALSSKDQTQTATSTKDPWGPAQQWIKDNMAAGQALQKNYTDNPFSDQQKTAYNNLGGLLNSANANNGNMSDFINRQMSGASYYDPKDPRKNYGKGVAQSNTFAPGLLNFFPK